MTNIEAVRAFTLTGIKNVYELARRSDNNLMPRASLAIIAALEMVFPSAPTTESWQKGIKAFTPVMITTNDFLDMDSYLKDLSSRSYGYDAHELRKVRSQIVSAHLEAFHRFCNTFPEHEQTAQWYVAASKIVQQVHPTDRAEVDFKQEIDSLIFEEACVRIFSQEVSLKAFGGLLIPREYEQLKQKYQPYLKGELQNSEQRKVAQMHTIEMVLKVIDDACGLKDDMTLGLSNLFQHSYPYLQRISKTKDFFSTINHQMNRAYELHIPFFISLSAALAFTATHVGKSIIASRSQRKEFQPGLSTTLREDFLNSPFLHQIPLMPRI